MNPTEATSTTTKIAAYSPVEAGIAEFLAKHEKVVYDVTTSKGMEAARKSRAECRALRVKLEETRVAEKADALAYGRRVDAEAKRIKEIIEGVENPLDEQIKAEEQRKEAEREAKIKAEAERIAAHRQKIDALKRRATDAIGKSSEQVRQMIDGLATTVSESGWAEQFEEFAAEAIASRDATLEFLTDLHDKTLIAEREAARIKAEREQLERDKAAQAKRDAEEREHREVAEREVQAKRDREDAERRRQQAADDQRRRDELAAEEQRQAQERERLAQQQREQDERQAKIDAEARKVQEARYAQEREEARQAAERRAADEKAEQDRQAEQRRRQEAEERAAQRRELVKAARRDSPEAALYEIAGIVIDPAKSDDIAREEIGVLCEANLPEKAGKATRGRKGQASSTPTLSGMQP